MPETKSRKPKRQARKGTSRTIAMPTIVRDAPAGHHWGWFSREDPRMHLQSVDGKNTYKIWLEEKGRRVFEPVEKIPAKVLKSIREAVVEKRVNIEDNWVYLMLKLGWLELHVALPRLTLVAYPGLPGKFTRRIDLAEWFTPEQLATLTPEMIELHHEMVALRLWCDRPEERTYDVRLSKLLWTD